MRFKNAGEVPQWRLCIGCGACASVCPENKITLIDIENDGIRPVVSSNDCGSCDTCLKVCPGIDTSVSISVQPENDIAGPSKKKWGSFIELWEGYASDPEIRFKGSSGGLCTALSVYSLESNIAGGILHIGKDPRIATSNKTYRSRTREELVARTGSRYSPAAPCNGFSQIETALDSSVFIGKPCDVAGLRKAQRLRPQLNEKTALAIGFFCAGTPSTRGILDLLKTQNIEDNAVFDLRYRGFGWPGMATVSFKDNREDWQLTYKESWGFVQRYRPFRCYLCPDLTAEFADISVGDPWYREIGNNEPGRSLILIRTEKGQKIFHQALKNGYVTAEAVITDKIYRSQKNLLGKRQAIWGRLLAMKLLGVPFPNLDGFYLFENWRNLPAHEKFRSILGTAKRIIQRKYFRPLVFDSTRSSWKQM